MLVDENLDDYYQLGQDILESKSRNGKEDEDDYQEEDFEELDHNEKPDAGELRPEQSTRSDTHPASKEPDTSFSQLVEEMDEMNEKLQFIKKKVHHQLHSREAEGNDHEEDKGNRDHLRFAKPISGKVRLVDPSAPAVVNPVAPGLPKPSNNEKVGGNQRPKLIIIKQTKTSSEDYENSTPSSEITSEKPRRLLPPSSSLPAPNNSNISAPNSDRSHYSSRVKSSDHAPKSIKSSSAIGKGEKLPPIHSKADSHGRQSPPMDSNGVGEGEHNGVEEGEQEPARYTRKEFKKYTHKNRWLADPRHRYDETTGLFSTYETEAKWESRRELYEAVHRMKQEEKERELSFARASAVQVREEKRPLFKLPKPHPVPPQQETHGSNKTSPRAGMSEERVREDMEQLRLKMEYLSQVALNSKDKFVRNSYQIFGPPANFKGFHPPQQEKPRDLIANIYAQVRSSEGNVTDDHREAPQQHVKTDVSPQEHHQSPHNQSVVESKHQSKPHNHQHQLHPQQKSHVDEQRRPLSKHEKVTPTKKKVDVKGPASQKKQYVPPPIVARKKLVVEKKEVPPPRQAPADRRDVAESAAESPPGDQQPSLLHVISNMTNDLIGEEEDPDAYVDFDDPRAAQGDRGGVGKIIDFYAESPTASGKHKPANPIDEEMVWTLEDAFKMLEKGGKSGEGAEDHQGEVEEEDNIAISPVDTSNARRRETTSAPHDVEEDLYGDDEEFEPVPVDHDSHGVHFASGPSNGQKKNVGRLHSPPPAARDPEEYEDDEMPADDDYYDEFEKVESHMSLPKVQPTKNSQSAASLAHNYSEDQFYDDFES